MQLKTIYDLTPFTMQDYPWHPACIVWMAGCNLRCPYCHNPGMVRATGRFTPDDVLAFLKTRQDKLQGVVFSGGEATTAQDLSALMRATKELGFKIKLDTNGTRPDRLAPLLAEKLLNYVAIDYKAPASCFAKVTGRPDGCLYSALGQSLDMLIDADLPVEIRTTWHADLMTPADINAIIADLDARGFKGTFYVQNFMRPVVDGMMLDETLSPTPKTPDTSMLIAPSGFKLAYRNFPVKQAA